MPIFGFDLLPYPQHLDHLKTDGERIRFRSGTSDRRSRSATTASISTRGR
jgi:hypothetical protein